jgi:membrane protein DedA with SNARE-associated domain
MPIVRTFISLPAGISKMNFFKFSTYSALGSLPWCMALGYVGYALGQHWEVIRPYFKILDVIVALAILGIIVYLVLKYKKRKAV